MKPFANILVPTDFGDSSLQATDMAVELAQRYGAKVTLMHAFEIPGYAYAGLTFSAVDLLTPVEQAAQRQLDVELESVRRRIPAVQAILRHGLPWQEILKVIDECHADLVVMGTHGRRGITHALLGSVAERVVRMSPVPVLTVRGTVAVPTAKAHPAAGVDRQTRTVLGR